MKKILLSTVALFTFLPLTTFAASPNWTFVEASYISTEVDGLDDDVGFDFEPDGFEVAGSLAIGDWVFVDAHYSEQSEDVDVEVFVPFSGTFDVDVDVDFDRVGAGIGVAWEVIETTDLYVRLGYEEFSIEADAAGVSEESDEDGLTADVGIRSLVWQSLELRGEIGYNDIVEEAAFLAGAYYTFAEHFTVGGSFEKIDDLETIRATLRYQF